MENLKFILVSLIVLVLVGFIGYWAVNTIEPGNINVYKQKQKDLEDQNAQLAKQVADLQSQVADFQAAQAQQTTQTPPTPTPVTTPTLKYQSLINDLQKLVDAQVSMKQGSQGTRVGTVQTFLNLYNKTSSKIDNDYGASTKTAVANFQKAQGLTADGAAGPSTFLKMITWLKKQ